MADMLGIGVSGLQAYQRALNTVSHNISNANTEGYSRQRVELDARLPTPTGAGFIGQGVSISSVTRMFDQFLVDQVRVNTSQNGRLEIYDQFAAQVDNLMADPDAGLTPTLQEFFASVQSLSNDPSSIPARQVVLSQAESLTDRFHFVQGRLEDLQEGVNSQLEVVGAEINSLAQSIAQLNVDIVNAENATGGQPPNDLLDERDLQIQQMAELVSVSVVEQDNGMLNIFIGNGQSMVIAGQANQMVIGESNYDPYQREVYIGSPTGTGLSNVTETMTGGVIGGTLDFQNEILRPAMASLGRVAIGLTESFNDQHQLGMDLQNTLGGDFFLDMGSTSPIAYESQVNTGSGVVDVSIANIADLTTSEYRLQNNGGVYTLTRLSDNTVTTLTTFPGAPETIDGFTLSLNSGLINDGDSFLIQPTHRAASDIEVAITDAERIAAASPVRSEADITNYGTAEIAPAVVTDLTTYIPDTYDLYMAAETLAVADGGVTAPLFVDAGGGNNLQYDLTINGTVVYSEPEGGPALADLDALAAVINDDVATTGVRAYVYNDLVVPANSRLYLVNEPSNTRPITLSETLSDSGGAALTVGDGASGYFGSVLSDATPTQTLSYTAPDSVLVLDSSSTLVSNTAYVEGQTLSFNGIETSISGSAELGDHFTVEENTAGVSDNTNALALMALQTQQLLNNGTADFQGSYGQLVADIGTRAHQVGLNLDASTALLNQAIEAREAMSGVNLDEEAANLIRFQQAYQAAAKVISVADETFQTLLNAVGA